MSAEKLENHQKADQPQEPRFVDGGWGWVIVFCCFVMALLAQGLLFSFGVLYGEVIEQFGSSSLEVAWIASIQLFVYYAVGPIVSAILTMFGGRVTVMAACTLLAAGFLISAVATNVYILYISMGVIGGGAIGMLSQSAAVLTSYYFKKRRFLASGIATSGGGVGVFIFPLLINFLFDAVGFQGACILLAGISMQGIICGSLILPPETTLRMQKKSAAEDPNDKKEVSESFTITDLVRNTTVIGQATVETRQGYLQQRHSFKSYDTCLLFASSIYYMQKTINMNRLTRQANAQSSGATTGLSKVDDSINHATHPSFTDYFKMVLNASCDIRLFKNPKFVFFLLGRMTYCACVSIPYTFVPTRARSFGLSNEQSSFLLSMVGIWSIIGRLFSGFVCDMDIAAGRRLYWYAANGAICGAAILVNFGETFTMQMIAMGIFGFSFGSFYAVCCTTLADLLGVNKLMKAYGMMRFLISFPALTGPVLGGYIFDTVGSYEIVFAYSGIGMTAGASLVLFLPCIQFYKHRTRKRKLEAQSNPAFEPDSFGNTAVTKA